MFRTRRGGVENRTVGYPVGMTTRSVNEIRTAIRELSARLELARREGRADDAAELDSRIAGYRDELGRCP